VPFVLSLQQTVRNCYKELGLCSVLCCEPTTIHVQRSLKLTKTVNTLRLDYLSGDRVPISFRALLQHTDCP
jgi:hypothetical protein